MCVRLGFGSISVFEVVGLMDDRGSFELYVFVF